MMYLILLFLTAAVPTYFLRHPNHYFYRKLPVIGLIFFFHILVYVLIWDAVFTEKGVWFFNPDHILGLAILQMPIEEWLFFLVAPYACLFIDEAVTYYVPEEEVTLGRWGILFLLLLFQGIAWTNLEQTYTFVTFLFASLICLWMLFTPLATAKTFWVSIAFSYAGFLLINSTLTGIWGTTVVGYNGDEIMRLRLFTIPLEDFSYHWGLIGSSIFFYRTLKE